MTEHAARAFVPGHVTGFFTVEREADPVATGSRGGGLTLTDGVTVAVQPPDTEGPSGGGRLVLDGSSVEVESVGRVLEALGVDARVEATTDLPLGAGFGVSGALALGTALAANAAFSLGLSENDLTRIAHVAEVEAGTGLGDVVAQARGGVPLRLAAGGPGEGTLDGIPDRARVEYVTFGNLATAEVITGETDALSAAGERALERVRDEPTLETFVAASRQFGREADLHAGRVPEGLETVADAGGAAAMAMLGETVFALGTGLSDAGYDPAVCEIDDAGARIRSE